MELANHHELTALGREVKWALNDSPYAQHPSDPRLSGVYGTILFDDLGDTADGPEQRNVTIYADGAVDRSPCGSGTASRVALLADEGRLGDHQRLVHHSIVGSTFVARVVDHVVDNGFVAVVPEVDGIAHRTGEHVFTLDPHDAIGTGFVLR